MPLAPPGPIAPGVYTTSGLAGLLRANEQQYLFQQQRIAAGQASIAVQLERINRIYYPFAASIQIWFTDVNQAAADPGAFEVDAQLSDNDVQYSDYTGLTAVNATSRAGIIQLTLIWAKFLRVNVKTLTNAVFTNVLVSR